MGEGPGHGETLSGPVPAWSDSSPVSITDIPLAHTVRMHCRPFPILLLGACLALAACGQEPPSAPPQPVLTSADSGGGAISTPAPEKRPLAQDVLAGTQWPAAQLSWGNAHVTSSTSYAEEGDGAPLVVLGYRSGLAALAPCRETGVVRLRYDGKTTGDFADMVERTTAMAERMEIERRVLDIDSSGGMVEDGIRAGDVIAESHWTIWVREGDMCHSACVFVLAAGDNRLVAGPVGIHRIIRLQSEATTRAELDAEL